MDGMEEKNHEFAMWQDFKTMAGLAYMAASWFSVTIEVFLRYRFGERYLQVMGSFVGFFIFMSYIFKGLLTPWGEGGGFSILSLIVMSVFFVLTLWHQRDIAVRRKKGIRWHSRSSGVSWGFWKVLSKNPATVQMYLEPIFCYILGAIVIFIDQDLSIWLMVCSVSLFVRGQIEYTHARNRFLDTVDAAIESEQLTAAMVDLKPPEETEGLNMAGMARNLPREERQKIANMMGGIDPALREMMGEKKPEMAEEAAGA